MLAPARRNTQDLGVFIAERERYNVWDRAAAALHNAEQRVRTFPFSENIL